MLLNVEPFMMGIEWFKCWKRAIHCFKRLLGDYVMTKYELRLVWGSNTALPSTPNFQTIEVLGWTPFMFEIPRSISHPFPPFLINELTSKDPDLDQDPTPSAAVVEWGLKRKRVNNGDSRSVSEVLWGIFLLAKRRETVLNILKSFQSNSFIV